jgi:hypothetical protein
MTTDQLVEEALDTDSGQELLQREVEIRTVRQGIPGFPSAPDLGAAERMLLTTGEAFYAVLLDASIVPEDQPRIEDEAAWATRQLLRGVVAALKVQGIESTGEDVAALAVSAVPWVRKESREEE